MRFRIPRSPGVNEHLKAGGRTANSLMEKPLAEDIVFTFYTYSNAAIPFETPWTPTGIPDIFFDSR